MRQSCDSAGRRIRQKSIDKEEDSDMERIVIVGGHGKVALHLARLLADRGDEATSVIRKAEQKADIEQAGGTPLVLDVENADVDEMAKAFSGADAVVWSAGAGGGSAERTYAVDRDAAQRAVDAASKAGVRRFVMVSWIGSTPDHGIDPDDSFFAYADAKLAADDHLRASDLDWTILGPVPSRRTSPPAASPRRRRARPKSLVPTLPPSRPLCSCSRPRWAGSSASARATR